MRGKKIYVGQKINYDDLFDYFNFSIVKDMEYYFKVNKKKTVYKVNDKLQIRYYRFYGLYVIDRK